MSAEAVAGASWLSEAASPNENVEAGSSLAREESGAIAGKRAQSRGGSSPEEGSVHVQG